MVLVAREPLMDYRLRGKSPAKSGPWLGEESPRLTPPRYLSTSPEIAGRLPAFVPGNANRPPRRPIPRHMAPPNVWSVNQKRTPLFPRSPTEMFNVRQSDACVLSSPDRLSLCSRDETLVQLLASATATLDSDRHRAKACIERAAELLQVSRVREEHGRSRSAASRGGLAPWQVKRVAAYIEAHFDSNVRAAELARVVRLSTSHFCRAFRESFGESPIAYVTRRRMRHAQVIMLLCREPLSQIALHCGMCDQAHFTRVFRKIVGINPSVWRRQFLPGTRALTTPAAGDQSAAL
jgi:AraC family transcriptional regulator